MAAWNFATLWEIAADNVPEAAALAHGTRTVSWADFDRRADGVARWLLDGGAAQQDKVALYLYNGPEYLEACFAAFKAGLVPVNTNYRYADDELVYLWDNADAVAVVFHGTFTERVAGVRARVPGVRTWLWVDDGSDACPSWAAPYEEAARTAARRVEGPWGRGDDDLLMIYTGGTTGMPKGVMWRQDDLVRGVIGASARRFRAPVDWAATRELITRAGRVGLPACPLMHGTGWFSALAILATAGCVVTQPERHFEAEALLDSLEQHRVNTVAIVGDTFGRPLLQALEGHPGRWDLSALMAITSSGVMWSAPVKQGLLRHLPGVQLIDNFGSSEAMGMGQSVTTTNDDPGRTARFALSANTRVVDDDDHDVVPGSGQVGRVAVRGHQPIGYYKDPVKSAATFVVIDGERYSIPGDYAAVDDDGTLVLLGRGSVCINTGGEKVFPEEVEEVLKLHSSVRDAVVVGVPDDRFGEAITAVVELTSGSSLDEVSIIDSVKGRLAHYKSPKRVVQIDTIGRGPNAKVDYKRLRQHALDALSTAG